MVADADEIEVGWDEDEDAAGGGGGAEECGEERCCEVFETCVWVGGGAGGVEARKGLCCGLVRWSG